MNGLLFILILLTVIELVLVAAGISFLVAGINDLRAGTHFALATVTVGCLCLVGAIVLGAVVLRLANGLGLAIFQVLG